MTTYDRVPRGLLPCILVAVAGCEDSAGAPSDASVVRDSAGIEIVTTDIRLVNSDAFWSVTPMPRQRIGLAGGDATLELFSVQDAHRFEDGRIAVANAGTNEVRFYGVDNQLLVSIGGEGEGPGEFAFIDSLYPVGDSIHIYDRGLERVSVVTNTGGFVRDFRATTTGDAPPPRPIGAFSDGSVVARSFPAFWADPDPGPQRFTDTYLRLSSAGETLDSIARVPGEETYVDVQDEQVVSMRIPFAHTPVSDVYGDMFYYGSGEAYEIVAYSSTGEMHRRVRLIGKPTVEPADALEEFIAELMQVLPEERREATEAHYRRMPLTQRMPAYSSLLVDAAGNLWVEDFRIVPSAAGHWSVFDPGGAYLGMVTLPPRFTPHQIGEDFVLGSSRDELDVERVDVYDLQK